MQGLHHEEFKTMGSTQCNDKYVILPFFKLVCVFLWLKFCSFLFSFTNFIANAGLGFLILHLFDLAI